MESSTRGVLPHSLGEPEGPIEGTAPRSSDRKFTLRNLENRLAGATSTEKTGQVMLSPMHRLIATYLSLSVLCLQANALMKAHNEKMASLLLDEDPSARHKPAHMGKLEGDLDPGSAASTSMQLMDELKAEIPDDDHTEEA